MPQEAAGSRAGDAAGSVFQRAEAGGGQVGDFGKFRESLGDLGKEKAFDPIKDFNGLAKSFVDSQKLLGRNVQIPPKDMKPEDRAKAIADIQKKLRAEGVLEGAPDHPEGYEIKTPQMEGVKLNEPLVNSFKLAAHKLGLTPAAVQGVFDWYLGFQEEMDREGDREFEEMKAGLKKEWGGLYTRKMEASRRAVTRYLGENGEDIIGEMEPEAGKKLIQAFAEIGESQLEEEILAGELPGVDTLESVEAKINAIVADTKHPVWDERAPGHKEAVEQWSKLQKMKILLQQKGRR